MTARPSFPATGHDAAAVSSADFRQAMAHVTASVHVITTAKDGQHRAGLTASAVTSLSDAPPMLLACIRTDSNTLAEIEANGVFCVNTLSDVDQAVAEAFAGRKGVEGEARFGIGEWTHAVTGSPVLTTALGSFDCRLIDVRTMATHRIVIGEVLALRGKQTGPGLIYRNRLFGTF
ncbi:MAG: flavin reductase family protein [Bosea sp. (in: a-proteobacteria)]